MIFAFIDFAMKEWCCFFAAGYHFVSYKSIFYHQEDAVEATWKKKSKPQIICGCFTFPAIKWKK